jgi:hypothetical protein
MEWVWLVSAILLFAFSSVLTVWAQRRRVRRELMPRKHKLEALLNELDGQ